MFLFSFIFSLRNENLSRFQMNRMTIAIQSCIKVFISEIQFKPKLFRIETN